MQQYKELLNHAKQASKYAYAPYSKFTVGAAVLTESGKIYTGCNIENASYGATNCAERTAIFKAVSQGETNLIALAIVSSSKDFTYPCGICRQVIGEFMEEGDLIFEDAQGEVKIIPFSQIYPYSFTKVNLTNSKQP